MAIACRACGADNPDDAKFCISCGTGLAAACPSCGNDNPPGANFCANCGTGLGRPDNAPMASRPESEAERRQLTVMFCDMAGSTELSRRLDPEDMRDVIRAFQDACLRAVERYDGFVAKYMGDGVLVYFGYPAAHEDDAERAINAGLGAVEAVGALERDLAVRIGIATGMVVVGDIVGEGASQEAAITGETPNLAARLQEIAGPNAVVIAENTRTLAGGMFELNDLGGRALKGFAEPVRVWSVSGARRIESRFDATRTESLTELIGRDEEMEILLRRWRRAKAGEGQVVLISGEPGIGKSRLARELQDRIADEPHHRLRHQCSPYHTNSALYPVIERLERAAGFETGDEAETKLAKLEALVELSANPIEETASLFASLLSIPAGERYPPLNVSPQRRKELTLRALVDQVAGIAAKRPVLFVLEDAHWIDPTTLELMELTVERATDAAVLLLITYRPEFDAPWIGRPRVTPMILGRLERRDCERMVAGVTGDGTLSDDIRDRISEQTDGVPLFIEELTRSVLETADPAAAIAVPATLQDSLEARLDRLGPAKEIAQIGSVIGRTFSYDLISRVARADDPNLYSALDSLVRSGLVTARGELPDATYSFKHALVQDAAYESLLRRHRAELHAKIAGAIEDIHPETIDAQPDLLARHYTEAGLNETAVGYWLRAAQAAFGASAMTESLAHAARGIEICEDLPSATARIDLEAGLHATRALALKASIGVGHTDTGDAFTRAYALCHGDPGSPYLFPTVFGLLQFNLYRGRTDEAKEQAEELMRLAKSTGEVDRRLVAHFALGMNQMQTGQFSAALENLERTRDLYDPDKHASLTFRFMLEFGVAYRFHLALIHLSLGHPDQALAWAKDAVATARTRQPVNLCASLTFGNHVQIFRGDVEDVLAWAEEGLELSNKHGFAQTNSSSRVNRGWALTRQGRADEGCAEIREGIEGAKATGFKSYLPRHFTILAEACIVAGRPEEALESTNSAFAELRGSGDRYFESFAWWTKGDALLAMDQIPEADTCYRRALDIARAQSAKSWELSAATRLARLWHSQGKTTEAHDLLAPIHGWFTEGFDTADLKEAKALLEQIQ